RSSPMIRSPLIALGLLLAMAPALTRADDKAPAKAITPTELMSQAIKQLVAIQEPSGAWPYEGVYRVGGQIPAGYRLGGTALVASTLLLAAPQDADAGAAVGRGLAFVLKELNDP